MSCNVYLHLCPAVFIEDDEWLSEWSPNHHGCCHLIVFNNNHFHFMSTYSVPKHCPLIQYPLFKKKLRPRDIVPDQTAHKWQSWDLNPGVTVSTVPALSATPNKVWSSHFWPHRVLDAGHRVNESILILKCIFMPFAGSNSIKINQFEDYHGEGNQRYTNLSGFSEDQCQMDVTTHCSRY